MAKAKSLIFTVLTFMLLILGAILLSTPIGYTRQEETNNTAVGEPSVTYSIDFNLNGENDELYETMTVSFGDYVEIAAPTRSGYKFLGWIASGIDTSTAKYGSTTKTIQSWTNSSTKVTAQYFRNLRSTEGTVTLTAQWSVTSYGISYDLAGGNFGTYHPESAEYDETVIISNPTQEGYEFSGWKAENLSTATAKYGESKLTDSFWSDSSAAVSSEYFSNLQQGAETVTLYATWDGNPYTVVFNGNGATSGSMANQSFVYGTYQNLTANAYSRTGYTFMGWSRSRTAVRPTYTDGQSVGNLATSGTVTLYAVWDANEYTLYFDANGGTVSPSSITVTYGMPYGYYWGGELPIPERLGYLPNGWRTISGGGTRYAIEASDTYNIAGDSTIYALWLETWSLYRSTPSGAGTYANPYKIATPENLGWLSYMVAIGNSNARNAYCEQTNNIIATDFLYIGGSLTVLYSCPIGTPTYSFRGNYDGCGFMIQFHFLGNSYNNYAGLFGYTSGATISNTYIRPYYNYFISTGTLEVTESGYIGGIAASTSGCSISNCVFDTGGITNVVTYTRIGIIIGYGGSSTRVVNCSIFNAQGNAYSSSNLAAYGSVTVTNCCYIINNKKGYTGSDFSNFVFVENMKIPLPKGISWLAEGGVPATMSTIQAWANS